MGIFFSHITNYTDQTHFINFFFSIQITLVVVQHFYLLSSTNKFKQKFAVFNHFSPRVYLKRHERKNWFLLIVTVISNMMTVKHRNMHYESSHTTVSENRSIIKYFGRKLIKTAKRYFLPNRLNGAISRKTLFPRTLLVFLRNSGLNVCKTFGLFVFQCKRIDVSGRKPKT